MFEITTNPPLLSYVLAPFVALWGLNEVVLHIPMVGFLLILALAMVALSVRFTSGSLWPLLFVMSTPAVVVSTNLMRDVPAMALSAASVAAFVWGSDRRDRRLLALGAILAGLAMLTKYSSLVLFAVQIGLGAVIGVADAQFADSARIFIQEEVPRLRKSGSEIWFCGNWGFRTYAEAAGLKDALVRPPMPPEGSLVLWPVTTHKSRFNPELKRRLILKEKHSFSGSVPIRTMSPEAGFYATVRWETPFRVTLDPKEIIKVYEVGPPQGQEERLAHW